MLDAMKAPPVQPLNHPPAAFEVVKHSEEVLHASDI